MNYYKQVANVLKIILIANLIVAVTKIIIGILMKYNSLLADGYHAITDSASNIIALVGIGLASKPPDKHHPYGHYKFEAIAGFFIGMMLLLITVKIIYDAINWFINPVHAIVRLENIIAIAFTLVINIFVSIIEIRIGRKLKSEVLITDAIHTRTDVFISLGVILSMILIKLGVPSIIDPILSLIIAFFVAHSCYQILKSTIGILVDRRVLDDDAIKTIVYQVDERIIDVHHIRNRGRDNNIFIDLHIIVPGELTVHQAHELSHKIQEQLRDYFNNNVDLYTHIEPNEKTP